MSDRELLISVLKALRDTAAILSEMRVNRDATARANALYECLTELIVTEQA